MILPKTRKTWRFLLGFVTLATIAAPMVIVAFGQVTKAGTPPSAPTCDHESSPNSNVIGKLNAGGGTESPWSGIELAAACGGFTLTRLGARQIFNPLANVANDATYPFSNTDNGNVWSGFWLTFDADMRNLAQIRLTTGGSGYTQEPEVVITGGGGSGAQATAHLDSGAIDYIELTDPGTGYTSTPSVSFTGGDGTGAAATAVLSTGLTIGNPFLLIDEASRDCRRGRRICDRTFAQWTQVRTTGGSSTTIHDGQGTLTMDLSYSDVDRSVLVTVPFDYEGVPSQFVNVRPTVDVDGTITNAKFHIAFDTYFLNGDNAPGFYTSDESSEMVGAEKSNQVMAIRNNQFVANPFRGISSQYWDCPFTGGRLSTLPTCAGVIDRATNNAHSIFNGGDLWPPGPSSSGIDQDPATDNALAATWFLGSLNDPVTLDFDLLFTSIPKENFADVPLIDDEATISGTRNIEEQLTVTDANVIVDGTSDAFNGLSRVVWLRCDESVSTLLEAVTSCVEISEAHDQTYTQTEDDVDKYITAFVIYANPVNGERVGSLVPVDTPTGGPPECVVGDESDPISLLTDPSDTEVIIRFANTSTCYWSVPEGTSSVRIVAIAGGGGGGAASPGGDYGGGGGGAGGFIDDSSVSVSGIISVRAGVGGDGANAPLGGCIGSRAMNGGNTIFGDITLNGGGAGGANIGPNCWDESTIAGLDGGSGGGASSHYVSGPLSGVPGTGVVGQGHDGGNARSDYNLDGGGGGGGARLPGGDATASGGGEGGAGYDEVMAIPRLNSEFGGPFSFGFGGAGSRYFGAESDSGPGYGSGGGGLSRYQGKPGTNGVIFIQYTFVAPPPTTTTTSTSTSVPTTTSSTTTSSTTSTSVAGTTTTTSVPVTSIPKVSRGIFGLPVTGSDWMKSFLFAAVLFVVGGVAVNSRRERPS